MHEHELQRRAEHRLAILRHADEVTRHVPLLSADRPYLVFHDGGDPRNPVAEPTVGRCR